MLAPKIWLSKYVDLSGISDKDFLEKMTFSGNKVEAIHIFKENTISETVYEFEITSNRPDTLSIIGLAREVSAVFNRKFTPPKIPSTPNLTIQPKKLNISDKKLCPTYSCVEISNITVKPSSQNIQKLITLAGHRPVNNIVDIANYILWEHAQLMHTFDADKIKGDLNLRLAKKNEKIITLDHKTRHLIGGEIIIEDKEKIIDVPGIMGGLNTEITSQTKRIYLLVAIDNPILIRRASINLKLRSPSSTRSEKKLDLTQTEAVTKRVVKLIEQESTGQQSTKIHTLKSNFKSPIIKLNQSQVAKLIGIEISQSEINRYLTSLSIKKTNLGYQPPAWRRDLETDIDLIEEIARLYGYNNLPKTLPTGIIPIHKTALKKNWLKDIKSIIAGLGYFETYSSTMISKDLITSMGLKTKSHLQALHPMSKDYEYMRTTTAESLLPLLKLNLKHTKNINLFELGTVFYPQNSSLKLPKQPLELCLLSTTVSYSQLKGQIQTLALNLGLNLDIKATKNPTSYLHPSNQAQIYLKNKLIGLIGQTLDKKAWLATLNVTELIKKASAQHQYPTISQFPPIIEDLTFTLPQKTHLGPVIKTIKSTHKLINKVNLTKTYHQNYTFNITYQSLIKPLSDKLIAPIRKKVVSNLKTNHRAKLIGKL
ncbi:MAG: phenylalanine--tRNA ligase subunit beta [Patescibacteria group bacterium]|nr:phenylalanine--tRNA ligase subunit beta [Patescibacteria group bacterium]